MVVDERDRAYTVRTMQFYPLVLVRPVLLLCVVVCLVCLVLFPVVGIVCVFSPAFHFCPSTFLLSPSPARAMHVFFSFLFCGWAGCREGRTGTGVFALELPCLPCNARACVLLL